MKKYSTQRVETRQSGSMRPLPAVPHGKGRPVRLELASCDTLGMPRVAQQSGKTDQKASNWCESSESGHHPSRRACFQALVQRRTCQPLAAQRPRKTSQDLAAMNPADQQRRMLEMQHKIRNDAQQQQHYLGEFADWNRDIAKKDKERRAAPTDLPPVRGGMRVGVRNSNAKADAGASKHRQQSAKAPGAFADCFRCCAAPASALALEFRTPTRIPPRTGGRSAGLSRLSLSFFAMSRFQSANSPK